MTSLCPICGKPFPYIISMSLDSEKLSAVSFVIGPDFCTGHSKYDPAFGPSGQVERRPRTPVPQAFYDAFKNEVPND